MSGRLAEVPAEREVPERPDAEPVVTHGWVNAHGAFLRVRPAQAMSDEFLAMNGVTRGVLYHWPAVESVVREPNSTGEES